MANLVLHTKLGSVAEIESPVVGTFNARSGFEAFEACKFDNGASGSAPNHYINYAATGMSHSVGCVEFWAILNDQAITNGQYGGSTPTYRRAFSLHSSATRYIGVTFSNGAAYATTVFINAASYIKADNYSIPAGTPFHAAVTWNVNGIGGGGETVQFYIDGVKKGYSTNTWTVDTMTNFKVGSTGDMGQSWYGATGYLCALDNVKVWDYDKTDFSDRFTEGGTAIVRPFSNKFNAGI